MSSEINDLDWQDWKDAVRLKPIPLVLSALCLGQHLDEFILFLRWAWQLDVARWLAWRGEDAPVSAAVTGGVPPLKLTHLLQKRESLSHLEGQCLDDPLNKIPLAAVAALEFHPLLQFRFSWQRNAPSCEAVESHLSAGDAFKLHTWATSAQSAFDVLECVTQFYSAGLPFPRHLRDPDVADLLRRFLPVFRTIPARLASVYTPVRCLAFWTSLCKLLGSAFSPTGFSYYNDLSSFIREALLEERGKARSHLPPMEDFLRILWECFKVRFTGSTATAAIAASQFGALRLMNEIRRESVLEPDRYGVTALQCAVEMGNVGAVDLLLEMQVPTESQALLHIAAVDAAGIGARETLSVIERLVRRGADMAEVRADSRSVLHVVCDPEVATGLVALGAPLEAKTALGETPLITAADANRRSVVEALCVCGADPNSRTNRGQTPLFVAAKRGFASIVESLLSHGADPSLRDDSGRTPLQAAIDGDRKQAVIALLKHDSGGEEPAVAAVEELLRGGLARRRGAKGP